MLNKDEVKADIRCLLFFLTFKYASKIWEMNRKTLFNPDEKGDREMFQFVKGKRPGYEITLQDVKQIEEKYQMNDHFRGVFRFPNGYGCM